MKTSLSKKDVLVRDTDEYILIKIIYCCNLSMLPVLYEYRLSSKPFYMLHLFRVILLLIFISGIIIGCGNAQIQFPEGGHDFPLYVAESETNDYFYPYKDSGSTRDSFADAEGYRF